MTIRLCITFVGISILCSCAGPMNPFGAQSIKMVLSDNNEADLIQSSKNIVTKNNGELQVEKIDEDITLEFYPPRQNWHDVHDIYIVVQSKYSDLYSENLKIFWNKKEITDSAKSISEVFYKDTRNMIFKIKNMRLLAGKQNDISAYYKNIDSSIIYSKQYEKPVCKINEDSNIVHTEPFKVKSSFVKMVKKHAHQEKINPNLLIGLIAQESGFDPNAVSYAKAIGLTQVTNLANKHVILNHENFKSDNRIEKLPVPVVRAMIAMGKINAKNEWRLDKEKSIIGGIDYLKYLVTYWEGNTELIKRVYGENVDREEILTDLILASYNSGPFRIKSRLIKDGVAWKNSKYITEARKYLGKIKSYCYHFSNEIQEEEYENKTANF